MSWAHQHVAVTHMRHDICHAEFRRSFASQLSKSVAGARKMPAERDCTSGACQRLVGGARTLLVPKVPQQSRALVTRETGGVAAINKGSAGEIADRPQVQAETRVILLVFPTLTSVLADNKYGRCCSGCGGSKSRGVGLDGRGCRPRS